MPSHINKFKIPTLLGISIIFAGIISGVLLLFKNQAFFTQASPNLTPQDITISNITDNQVNISWQTSQPTVSFISFSSKNSSWQNALDDKDNLKPKPHALHFTTIKNLNPQTEYLFKIVSGRQSTPQQSFKTAKLVAFQNGFGPIRGTALDNQTPLSEALVYLSIQDAIIQSAQVTSMGNFLIPLSQIQKNDLSDTFTLNEDAIGKLSIVSGSGSATTLFKIKSQGVELPPIKIGQNLDLLERSSPMPKPANQSNKFDLNGDGKVNAKDYAIVLQNFGKNPKNKAADLNGDGIVDQKDLDLISKQINQ